MDTDTEHDDDQNESAPQVKEGSQARRFSGVELVKFLGGLLGGLALLVGPVIVLTVLGSIGIPIRAELIGLGALFLLAIYIVLMIVLGISRFRMVALGMLAALAVALLIPLVLGVIAAALCFILTATAGR